MTDTAAVQQYLSRSILSVGPANPLPQAIAAAIPEEWLEQIPLHLNAPHNADDYRRIIENGIRAGLQHLSRAI